MKTVGRYWNEGGLFTYKEVGHHLSQSGRTAKQRTGRKNSSTSQSTLERKAQHRCVWVLPETISHLHHGCKVGWGFFTGTSKQQAYLMKQILLEAIARTKLYWKPSCWWWLFFFRYSTWKLLDSWEKTFRYVYQHWGLLVKQSPTSYLTP